MGPAPGSSACAAGHAGKFASESKSPHGACARAKSTTVKSSLSPDRARCAYPAIPPHARYCRKSDSKASRSPAANRCSNSMPRHPLIVTTVNQRQNVTFIFWVDADMYSCDLLLNTVMDSPETNRKVQVSENRRQPQLLMAHSIGPQLDGWRPRTEACHSIHASSANQKGRNPCASVSVLALICL